MDGDRRSGRGRCARGEFAPTKARDLPGEGTCMSHRLYLYFVRCSDPLCMTMVCAKSARTARRLYRLARGCEGKLSAKRVQKKSVEAEVLAFFPSPAELRGWF
jgi:hypothetical protein